MQLPRILVAGVGIVAAIGLASTEAAAECETPLPDDISIAEPSASLPPERAAFLGMWGDGRWEGNLCNTLVVESIGEDGSVKGVYGWDTYSAWRIKEGYRRFEGKITSDNKLKFTFPNIADVTYWFDGDKLKGTYYSHRSGNTSRITIQRK